VFFVKDPAISVNETAILSVDHFLLTKMSGYDIIILMKQFSPSEDIMNNGSSADKLRSKRSDAAVRVAAQLFLSNGIEAVKMTDIADLSGIGVATLYRYFGTKTGITIASMTYLWNDMRSMFSGVFESEVFLKQKGIKQLEDLMKMFVVLYEAHPRFMKLLSEFDLMIVSEGVPKAMLKEYDRSIINFYCIFEGAYLTGLSDGSVREIPDLRLFYVTFAHALMQMSMKLINGELLPSDDFSLAKNELELLIEAAVCYLKK